MFLLNNLVVKILKEDEGSVQIITFPKQKAKTTYYNTFATENSLVFQGNGQFIGFESNGIKVRYTKLPISTDIPKFVRPPL